VPLEVDSHAVYSSKRPDPSTAHAAFRHAQNVGVRGHWTETRDKYGPVNINQLSVRRISHDQNTRSLLIASLPLGLAVGPAAKRYAALRRAATSKYY
jgi:hypothetical protein